MLLTVDLLFLVGRNDVVDEVAEFAGEFLVVVRMVRFELGDLLQQLLVRRAREGPMNRLNPPRFRAMGRD